MARNAALCCSLSWLRSCERVVVQILGQVMSVTLAFYRIVLPVLLEGALRSLRTQMESIQRPTTGSCAVMQTLGSPLEEGDHWEGSV